MTVMAMFNQPQVEKNSCKNYFPLTFRTLLSEKEELEQCRVSFERKFHDLMSQTSSVLRIEDYSSSSMENVIAKVRMERRRPTAAYVAE